MALLSSTDVQPPPLFLQPPLHNIVTYCCRWWACKPAPTTTSALTSLVVAATPQLALAAEAIAGQPISAAAAAATAESPEIQAATASARAALADVRHDLVAVIAPRRIKAGASPTLAITVNRQGEPVADATVFVQITTKRRGGGGAGGGSTVTVSVTTGPDGTASLAVPEAVQGVKGARTTIEAFTNDARAMGVKGSVPVVSARRRMVWA